MVSLVRRRRARYGLAIGDLITVTERGQTALRLGCLEIGVVFDMGLSGIQLTRITPVGVAALPPPGEGRAGRFRRWPRTIVGFSARHDGRIVFRWTTTRLEIPTGRKGTGSSTGAASTAPHLATWRLG